MPYNGIRSEDQNKKEVFNVIRKRLKGLRREGVEGKNEYIRSVNYTRYANASEYGKPVLFREQPNAAAGKRNRVRRINQQPAHLLL